MTRAVCRFEKWRFENWRIESRRSAERVAARGSLERAPCGTEQGGTLAVRFSRVKRSRRACGGARPRRAMDALGSLALEPPAASKPRRARRGGAGRCDRVRTDAARAFPPPA